MRNEGIFMELEYQEFLKKKIKTHIKSGFDIDEDKLNQYLFPFQKFIVTKALKAGKYAVFAECGLGKTICQLEWANQVAKHTDKPVLILAPLAVSGQTIREGKKFGIDVIKYDGSDFPIQITNYEQLDNVDCNKFVGIVADESGILKNYEGSIKNKIMELFKNTPYKLACTATPSPNDPMELGNHAEFLDVMNRNEMLAMYFVYDGGETSKWRIKKHAIDVFYRWVGSWAIMLNNPSDIGYPMSGYDLPKLNIIEKMIVTPNRGNGALFNDVAVSATNFNQELRLTRDARLKEVADIVNNNKETFIIWIKHNEEGDMLKRLVPDCIEVRGNDSLEWKEDKLLGFANGDFRVLLTKSKIASHGLNYQSCHNQIFASLDFSFESAYQSIRRSYRFGQAHEVNIYMITTDTMTNVITAIKRKEQQFKEMQDRMCKMVDVDILSVGNYDTEEVKNDNYHIRRGDSFNQIKEIESNSIDASIFSPPFSSLYVFSDSVNDLSNCLNHDEFYEHFSFMVPELLRIVKPGRLLGMHLTQLTTGIAKDGYYSIVDFRGEIIRLFQKYGWLFHAEVTIWKSPELAAIRTKNHQLLHKSTKKDSTICRPGLADYLVIMRKPGINQDPVNHNGTGIPFEEWVKIASPVWMDVSESDTLGKIAGRDMGDERHITPTQLKVIKNFLILYSNKGDTVFTPFMGIGSEVYQAVKMGRKGIGIELKKSYYNCAKNNLQTLMEQKSQINIMDYVGQCEEVSNV